MDEKCCVEAAPQALGARYVASGADKELLAQVCHEANRAICVGNGDFSQPAWADAPDWQRESCLGGVQSALATPYQSPWQSHDGWMARKLREGWRYGPTKDLEAKVHPCLLPYGELPLHEQLKDSVFLSIVRGFLEARKA